MRVRRTDTVPVDTTTQRVLEEFNVVLDGVGVGQGDLEPEIELWRARECARHPDQQRPSTDCRRSSRLALAARANEGSGGLLRVWSAIETTRSCAADHAPWPTKAYATKFEDLRGTRATTTTKKEHVKSHHPTNETNKKTRRIAGGVVKKGKKRLYDNRARIPLTS